MRIAIVGAGRIGGNIARQLARAGHDVTVSFARDLDALRARAAEIGAAVAEPAASSAAGSAPHGTDTTTTSAPATASAGSATAAPISPARARSASTSRAKLTVTS